MADFSPPWSSVGGVNRSPSTDEQADGFQCGEADLTLFNRLFGRIEAEMKAIQDAGGISGTETDDTTVLQAIQALINAATGGGATSDYVLFSQAQARLPIFPEVLNSDGKIAVSAPSTGNIRVPASVNILHRGIRTYTTIQTDLPTVASKTYHLRWQVSAGVGTFVLKDLADTSYNPTVAAEGNVAFDSTYDDMLVARIITNSSNVASITPLVNKNRFDVTGSLTLNSTDRLLGASTPVDINLARKPNAAMQYRNDIRGGQTTGEEIDTGLEAASRYTLNVWYRRSVLFGANADNGTIGWSAWL